MNRRSVTWAMLAAWALPLQAANPASKRANESGRFTHLLVTSERRARKNTALSPAETVFAAQK